MRKTLLALILSGLTATAAAEIVVGVSVSSTGPGASLGVHIANAVALMPKSMGGEPVRYVVLDDASDPTAGAKHARRFATDDKVDVILGSSTVPVAMAQGGVASEARIPFIAICPIAIDPAKQPFVFAVPQPISLMVDAIVEHMKKSGVSKVGYIGFADAWGDMNHAATRDLGAKVGITIVANERFARTDTSATAQALKLIAAGPDAVFVGGSGAPSALPQVALAERGYRKLSYHTHGVVNRDFIRVGGKSAEGALAPTGPVVVAEQLPADHPLKAPGLEFVKRYEAAYGAGNRNAFAAYAWDASLIVQAAVPTALKAAKPGSAAFRQALRDALESGAEVSGTHAVYQYTASDHHGVDRRARVMVKVEGGDWKLVP